MYRFKQHRAYKIVTLMIMLVFLLPYAIKLGHVFNHHQHEICNGEVTAHLHKKDVDCDFYKFKLSTQYHTLYEYFELPIEDSFFKINSTLYNFLINHRQLSFSLRGPPVLV